MEVEFAFRPHLSRKLSGAQGATPAFIGEVAYYNPSVFPGQVIEFYFTRLPLICVYHWDSL